MEYRRLGSSGLMVSRIGLGMISYGDPSLQSWALTEDQAEPIVRQAVAAGIIFFDTADTYSDGVSEQITGRLLRKLFTRRDDYVLATKAYYPTGPGPNDRGLSRKHILAAIDASLARLGTDHVDVYQVHRFDAGTPAGETMTALDDIVRSGRARYLGASAMYAWQLAKLQHAAAAAGLTRFTAMQNRYNLVNREDERDLIPLCRDLGLGVIPYSPLARGLLAGTVPGTAPGVPPAPAPTAATGRGPRRRRRRAGRRHRAWPASGPGRHRLAARPGRHHRTADRRHPRAAHRRRGRRAGRAALRRGEGPARSGLPGPPAQRLLN